MLPVKSGLSSFRSLTLGVIACLLMSASLSVVADTTGIRIETSEGVIEVALRPDLAPATVENFLEYVDDGFYQDVIFHRVIPGFMIQTGGFDADLKRMESGDPVVNESRPTARNLRGTLAMARTSNPDSATSQFFINLTDNAYLDARGGQPGYTVFGRVTEGMGVVDSIAATPTGVRNRMEDVPLEPVVIHRIERIEPQAPDQ